MLAGCAVAQDLPYAERLMARMAAHGVRGNSRTLTALMNLYVKCGRPERAVACFQAHVERAREIGGRGRGGGGASGRDRSAGRGEGEGECRGRGRSAGRGAPSAGGSRGGAGRAAAGHAAGAAAAGAEAAFPAHGGSSADAAGALRGSRQEHGPSVTAHHKGHQRKEEEEDQPSVVTYNLLIDALGKLGRWREALGVVQAMEAQVGGVWGWALSLGWVMQEGHGQCTLSLHHSLGG